MNRNPGRRDRLRRNGGGRLRRHGGFVPAAGGKALQRIRRGFLRPLLGARLPANGM